MPWITKSKVDYKDIIQKNKTYIVKKSEFIVDRVRIIQYQTRLPIILLTQEDCREMFYPPEWITEEFYLNFT